MHFKNFAKKYITGACRDCLNQISGMQLTTRDCLYDWRDGQCPHCHDYRHIVVDLRWRGRLKVLFHRENNP